MYATQLPDSLPVWIIVSLAAAGIALIALHLWLVRRNPFWLGAIVPAIYLLIAAGVATQQPPTAGLLAGYGITFVVLLVLWWLGEESRRQRRGE